MFDIRYVLSACRREHERGFTFYHFYTVSIDSEQYKCVSQEAKKNSRNVQHTPISVLTELAIRR
jgi:hypothetical protein